MVDRYYVIRASAKAAHRLSERPAPSTLALASSERTALPTLLLWKNYLGIAGKISIEALYLI